MCHLTDLIDFFTVHLYVSLCNTTGITPLGPKKYQRAARIPACRLIRKARTIVRAFATTSATRDQFGKWKISIQHCWIYRVRGANCWCLAATIKCSWRLVRPLSHFADMSINLSLFQAVATSTWSHTRTPPIQIRNLYRSNALINHCR